MNFLGIDWAYTLDFWGKKLGLKRVEEPPPAPKPKPKTAKPLKSVKDETWNKFNPGKIITDKEFRDADAMSEKQIQDFLVSKGGVILPDTKINGHLVSYWMRKHCAEQGLNPKVLMTHMQKEMGAVTRKRPYKKQRTYDYILGVGATDGGDRSKWAGMDRQMMGAVQTCIKWYDRGEKRNTYPSSFNASDRPGLQLENSATFSLYKYTPWVGDKNRQIGRNLYNAPFGNFLFWRCYRGFFKK